MYCTGCGHRNDPEAKFCAKCGRPLEENTTVSLSPIEPEDSGEGFAEFAQSLGPNAGSRFLMAAAAEVTSVGRAVASGLFLDDVTVSRRHAEVRRRPDGMYVHDLQSLNGTYLNGERVDQSKLASGDEIQIGRFKLVFLMGE